MSLPKIPVSSPTALQSGDVPVVSLKQSPEGKPLRFCDSAQTTNTPALETTLYSRCDGFEKVIVARPANGQALYDYLEVAMGGVEGKNGPVVSINNRELKAGIRPEKQQVAQEIIDAMKRSYSDDVLSALEAQQWQGFKQQVYIAASDGKFSPAEENAIIASAQKIASGARKK